ncbi:hypothetical protein CY0110_17452 [Crocosphaera chwakensis CCY0110]|uniref:Uncharacterized protein n=1 Tax=Crocosphaera chwakensis CCY0110 TaxID=391612 RepID=A3IIH2_9CHRO|nr:hypothetical protein CY0110_17452 [Crocosphaera chwakensis CCY0110]
MINKNQDILYLLLLFLVKYEQF